ncbi:MAG: cobalt-precorrin-6A reductase [Pseudomonadota bacterium]
MTANLLILGGTTEATRLAEAVAAIGAPATLSYAERVARAREAPLPVRVGGFGGPCGLADYIQRERVSHVIDATHPFAAQMSENAAIGAREAGVPLVALTRPPWRPIAGDDWVRAGDIEAAVAALEGPARRVMLAIGRLDIDEFAAQPQHHYLLRLVAPPTTPPDLPNHEIIISRGPFTAMGDTKLFADHGIEVVVAKNAGGADAAAKLAAARALGLKVVLIDRPPQPEREEVSSVEAVFAWLKGRGVDLGV